MKIGDRIYYTGDMANIEDKGTIFKIRPATKYGPLSYDIRLDDGREFLGVYDLSFQPSIGRRFWLLTDWKKDRDEKIKDSAEHMKKVLSYKHSMGNKGGLV